MYKIAKMFQIRKYVQHIDILIKPIQIKLCSLKMYMVYNNKCCTRKIKELYK